MNCAYQNKNIFRGKDLVFWTTLGGGMSFKEVWSCIMMDKAAPMLKFWNLSLFWGLKFWLNNLGPNKMSSVERRWFGLITSFLHIPGHKRSGWTPFLRFSYSSLIIKSGPWIVTLEVYQVANKMIFLIKIFYNSHLNSGSVFLIQVFEESNP